MDWIEVIASNDRLGEDRNHSKTSEKTKTGLTKISNTETLHGTLNRGSGAQKYLKVETEKWRGN